MSNSTQPSAPKPVASATSGPNSSMAQRSMSSGAACSNCCESVVSSTSAISSASCNSSAIINLLPLFLQSMNQCCNTNSLISLVSATLLADLVSVCSNHFN